jgi:GNAT superfamily N-acetyltransferase
VRDVVDIEQMNQRDTKIVIQEATKEQLAEINAVIERAVMNWNLPERVKRLSLSSHQYRAHDFDHMELLVAQTEDSAIAGIAACEALDSKSSPAGTRTLLLHGIYVDPPFQRRGIGSQLLAAAERSARLGGYTGLLVKAQSGADAFFAARGMERLAVDDESRDYRHRFWKPASA